MNWHPQAYQDLLKNNLNSVVFFYENAIEQEPENITHYLYLGLAYLLNENEESAQTTWLFALSQGSEDEVTEWAGMLTDMLELEAQRQQQVNQLYLAWLLRQHLKEIESTNLANLFSLLSLSIKLKDFEPSMIEEWDLVNLLRQKGQDIVEPDKLLTLLIQILDYPSEEVLKFTDACIVFANDKRKWVDSLLLSAVKIGDVMERPVYGAELAKICLLLEEKNLAALRQQARLSLSAKRFKTAIESAEQYCNLSQELSDKFLSNNLLLGALTQAGDWFKVPPVLERHRELLDQIFLQDPDTLDVEVQQTLITANAIFAYYQDNLIQNRHFHNRVGILFDKHSSYYVPRTYSASTEKPLKIGYIAHTLRLHSVGWLSRWLFQHHDREQFHTSIYLVNDSLEDSFYHEWFASKVDNAQACPIDALDIADRIHNDEIDILVDLDSITLNVTYTTLSFKPAPIQATWLGWDAPGLPTVDYFITDPYVLPEDASQYYQEKLWQLPHTYIAVDGFEVGVPTIRREDLNIPSDAVIFLSSQVGMKRHPDTIRLQLRILKEVPNSYFLIKGLGDEASIKEVFISMAEQEGVSPERICFRGLDATEYHHRANLQLADVVLDTYPYNGATTTLETLWMGIPVVTKAGNTFSSRNTYAFLQNVGVTEGVSWTNEEYIEWGIRLGRDEQLRQQISWKLKQSRRSSPLWNAKQFTRDMENAYQQMWANYLAQR
jgi:predicted O-linked N-acetylglucosamine transferase (SPINDLY family)